MRLALEIVAIAALSFPALYWWGRRRVRKAPWKPVVDPIDNHHVEVKVRKPGVKRAVPVPDGYLNALDPEYEANLRIAVDCAENIAKTLNDEKVNR
jgi:hypothetical protein